MSAPQIKICGLRRMEDAVRAVELGATWLGCVVAPESPRCAEEAELHAIARLCAEAERALVIVGRAASAARVHALVRQIGDVDAWAQVHGGEAEGRAIRVVRVDASASFATTKVGALRSASSASPVLFDCGEGGTGRRFDWSQLAPRAPRFAFVAGGISPENVHELMDFEPWGIDVSSGVESRPGVKDHDRLRALFDAIAKSALRSEG